MLSAIATDLKDFSLSPDGKEAKFVLVTKYAGDIEVTVPSECLNALQAHSPDTKPLVSPPNLTRRANGQPSTLTPVAGIPVVRKLRSPAETVPAPQISAATGPKTSVAITVPKTWLVATDAQRGLVVVVLNHKMDDRLGFALEPKAAREMASALNKQADALPPAKPVPQA